MENVMEERIDVNRIKIEKTSESTNQNDVINKSRIDNKAKKSSKKRKRPYISCYVCKKETPCKLSLIAHMKTFHPECIMTNDKKNEEVKTFHPEPTVINVKRKRKTTKAVFAKKKIRCTICQRPFNKPSNLKHHMVIQHTVKIELPETQVAESNNLHDEIGNINGENSTNVHKKNAKTIKQETKFHSHTKSRLVSKNNRYQCQICGKIYSNMGNLSRHKKKQMHVMVYQCQDCFKSFGTNFALGEHIVSEHKA